MKIALGCLICGIFLHTQAFSQQITPSVVNSTGTTMSGSGGMITGNVGESAVTKISNGVYLITQGFLQPKNQNTTSIAGNDQNNWTVYPNPSSSTLSISTSNGKEPVWARITDQNGKEVFFAEVSGGQILLNGLNNGSYQLQILNSKKEILSTKTITKIN